jgi:hypothetical protein
VIAICRRLQVADRFWVTLSKGEQPGAARPFLATGDPGVVRDVLSSLARHLGFAVPEPRIPRPVRAIRPEPDGTP